MGNIFVSPTADKIARGYNLENKVAIITGASSGIGLETTRSLAKRGATVLLTCRDVSAGEKAKRLVLEQIGERFACKILVMKLDLASLCSVKQFVEEFVTLDLPLHYVVLNAAVLGGRYRLTKEGFEMHFGVNYLGHFYLTQLLLPVLQKQEKQQVRIVAVCCTPPRRTKLKLKSIAVGKRQSYNAFKAYDQSKLALRYLAEELSVRLKQSNVCVVGADPGATYTWIVKNLNPIILSFMAFASIFMKSPPQGAATVVFACLDNRVTSKARPFCANCRLLKLNVMRCRNPKLRKELFELSEDLVLNAVFDSCESEVFSPKAEVFKGFSTMTSGWMSRRGQSRSKRRISSTAKYQKLE